MTTHAQYNFSSKNQITNEINSSQLNLKSNNHQNSYEKASINQDSPNSDKKQNHQDLQHPISNFVPANVQNYQQVEIQSNPNQFPMKQINQDNIQLANKKIEMTPKKIEFIAQKGSEQDVNSKINIQPKNNKIKNEQIKLQKTEQSPSYNRRSSNNEFNYNINKQIHQTQHTPIKEENLKRMVKQIESQKNLYDTSNQKILNKQKQEAARLYKQKSKQRKYILDRRSKVNGNIMKSNVFNIMIAQLPKKKEKKELSMNPKTFQLKIENEEKLEINYHNVKINQSSYKINIQAQKYRYNLNKLSHSIEVKKNSYEKKNYYWHQNQDTTIKDFELSDQKNTLNISEFESRQHGSALENNQFKTTKVSNIHNYLGELFYHSEKKKNNRYKYDYHHDKFSTNYKLLKDNNPENQYQNFVDYDESLEGNNDETFREQMRKHQLQKQTIKVSLQKIKDTIQNKNKQHQTIPQDIKNLNQQIKGVYKQKKEIPLEKKVIDQPQRNLFLVNMMLPKLPNPPSIRSNSKELAELGKKILEIFKIKIKNNSLLIKKFKNCIYFNANNYHIIWNFNGKFYIGGWKNNSIQGEKQGHGIEYIPQTYIYEGNFKNGKRYGFGKIKYQNGDIYKGDWIDGFCHGNGVLIEKNGIKYEGQWKYGKKEGIGKLIVSERQIYEGGFLDNLKNGYGKQTFKMGDTYQGEYYMSKFSGKGRYTWFNGASYEGQFYNGCRNGFGIWKSNKNPNCHKYKGQYKNDKKCGKGRYDWSNGTFYEGEFLNDLKHGIGILQFQNGKIMKAIWENGIVKKKLQSNQNDLTSSSPYKNHRRSLSSNKNMQQPDIPVIKKYNINNKISLVIDKIPNQNIDQQQKITQIPIKTYDL